MAMLSDMFDKDGRPMENDPLAIARALAGMKPQTQGTAYEPVTSQQQLQNYRQLEGQQQAWQTAEGSPWKPPEPGAVAQMLSRILQSEPGQRAMMLANFLGPGPRVPGRAMAPEGGGKTWYHGTDTPFDVFDLSKAGKTDWGFMGKGAYLTPDKGMARRYGQHVLEFEAKGNIADSADEAVQALRGEAFKAAKAEGAAKGLSDHELTSFIKDRMNERFREAGYSGYFDSTGDELVMFDPTNLVRRR
jgi:hypothetical protein